MLNSKDIIIHQIRPFLIAFESFNIVYIVFEGDKNECLRCIVGTTQPKAMETILAMRRTKMQIAL